MSAVTPGHIMVEARRLAREAALLLIEKPGPIWYIYRPLPDGRKTFIGKLRQPRRRARLRRQARQFSLGVLP